MIQVVSRWNSNATWAADINDSNVLLGSRGALINEPQRVGCLAQQFKVNVEMLLCNSALDSWILVQHRRVKWPSECRKCETSAFTQTEDLHTGGHDWKQEVKSWGRGWWREESYLQVCFKQQDSCKRFEHFRACLHCEFLISSLQRKWTLSFSFYTSQGCNQ